MKKLILQMQMSVDGFVGAHADHDWQLWNWGDDWPWDDALKQDFNAVFAGIDTILLSRKMAEEGYLTHWGKAANIRPTAVLWLLGKLCVGFGKGGPKDRFRAWRWGRRTVVSGNLPDEVDALKAAGEGDIVVFGGAGFASALIAAGLVDEFQLFINPAVLGDGVRIFDAGGFSRLRLLGSKVYACGMVVNRYAPAA